jgi:1,4-dihydroxy-2-naphthoate octaprenyltransferase
MFQPPHLPDLNLQLLVTLVMGGLLIGTAIAYTRQKRKLSWVNLSKKLIPVSITLGVGLLLLSLLTQPQFREISQTCKDYQFQKTLYASTPVEPSCDREIADSEATYLAAYPLFANRQSPLKYIGLLALGGGVVVALRVRDSAGRTRRGVLRSRTLQNT